MLCVNGIKGGQKIGGTLKYSLIDLLFYLNNVCT